MGVDPLSADPEKVRLERDFYLRLLELGTETEFEPFFGVAGVAVCEAEEGLAARLRCGAEDLIQVGLLLGGRRHLGGSLHFVIDGLIDLVRQVAVRAAPLGNDQPIPVAGPDFGRLLAQRLERSVSLHRDEQQAQDRQQQR